MSVRQQEPALTLPVRLARIEAEDPNLYQELFLRYSEAVIAIEQDDVTRLEDAVDGSVEDELFDLIEELDRIDATLGDREGRF